MRRRGLLLDRDGVINVDHGFVGRCEQFEFMPGLFPFLRTSQDMGFRLAILTNQSGVARGLYTAKAYDDLTTWMRAELLREGITIDLVLACFYSEEGTLSAYTRESFWRKPNPGMVLEAFQRLRLDPTGSVFLGDKHRDMQAAKAGGCGLRLLLRQDPQENPDGAIVVHDFDEALKNLQDFIKGG